MKKILIISSLVVFYSCGGNGDKKQDSKVAVPTINKNKKEQTAEDLEMQKWMQGKIWTAEESMAPMSLLKLKADGGYELKSSGRKRDPPETWKIINGEISMVWATEWPVEKIDDKTFRLYVKPTDTWYTYKHTADL